jgi:hypothetical protein
LRREFCERHPECDFSHRKRRPCLSKACGKRWPPYFPDDHKL